MAKAAQKMDTAPKISKKEGKVAVTKICAMKATKICKVRKVATVEGGIIVRDLVAQKKPKRPLNEASKAIIQSKAVISEMAEVKNRSLSSINWQEMATNTPMNPM